MCDFFSAIVFRTGAIRFCEDPSHETIITRLGLDDAADLFTRAWARVECVAPFAAVRVDETSTPGWYGEDRAAIDGRVMDLAQRVAPLLATYQAGRDQLWATYQAGRAPLLATYQAGRAPLWATREAGCASLEATYEAGRASLLATYEAGRAPLLATYEAGRAALWDAYQAGRAQLLATYADGIRSIEGYVPKAAK